MLQIITGKLKTPYAVVIHGQEGVGKSTLAKDFPGALFMDSERSTERFDLKRLPRPRTWSEAKQQVAELTIAPLPGFKTLIIDTWDWLLQLGARDIIASRPKDNGEPRDSIESFGYGRGYTYLAEEAARMLDALNELRDRAGWHVVLLCHSALRKFELPEEEGQYDRWEMKIERRPQAGTSAFSLTKEWPDLLLFARYKTIVEETANGKKKAHGQKRVMQTEHSAVWDAKNRDGLKPELPLEFASIAHLFQDTAPAKTTPKPAPQKPATPKPTTKPAAPKKETPPPQDEDEVQSEQEAAEEEAAEAYYQDVMFEKLDRLMEGAGVTGPEIMAVIAMKGYFPADMDYRDLPEDFVEGKVIPFFNVLSQKAIANRKGQNNAAS